MKNGIKRVLCMLLAVLLLMGTVFSDTGLVYQVQAASSGTQDDLEDGESTPTPTGGATPQPTPEVINNSISFQVDEEVWNAIKAKYMDYGLDEAAFSKAFVTWNVTMKDNAGQVLDSQTVTWSDTDSEAKTLTANGSINAVTVSISSLKGFTSSLSAYEFNVSIDESGSCELSTANVTALTDRLNAVSPDTSGFSMDGSDVTDIAVGASQAYNLTVPEPWDGLSYEAFVENANVAEVSKSGNTIKVTGIALGDTVLTVKWKKSDGTVFHTITRNISVGTDTQQMSLKVTPDNVPWGEDKTLTITASVPEGEGISADIYNGRQATLTYQTSSASATENNVGTATIDNGTVSFDLTVSSTSVETYTFKLELAASATHRAVTSESTYNLAKQDQSFTVTKEENVTVVYGVTGKTVANITGNNGDGTYAIVYTDVSGNELSAGSDVADLSLGQESNGKIPVEITPKKSGTVYYKIRREETENYNASVSDILSVSVEKKKITLSAQAEDRAYNAEITVNVKVSTTGLEQGDVDQTWTTTGQMTDANVGTAKQVTVDLEKVVFSDDYKTKYEFAYNSTNPLTTTVNISKKEITMEVQESTTEHTKTAISNIESKIEYGGYLNGDEQYVEDPDLCFKEGVSSDTLVEGEYEGIIFAKEGTGKAGDNYFFNFVTQIPGNLIVKPETVAENQVFSYIKVDNQADENKQVFQNENTIYYKTPDELGMTVAKFTILNPSDYTKLLFVKEDGNTEDITDSGFVMPTGSEGNQSFSFKLSNADGTKTTNEFTVDFVNDSTNPDIDITISENKSIIKSFLNTITFGIFSKNTLAASVTVNDPGEIASGIKEFSYCVVDTIEDTNFDAESITKDNVTEKFTGRAFNTVSGANTAEFTVGAGDDETIASNQYIVFVYAQDWVGNAVLYSSEGMVIDAAGWKPNELSVSYAEDMKPENKDDFFNRSVQLDVKVAPADDGVYSGVKSIDYKVEKEETLSDSGNLFTQEETKFTIEGLKSEIATEGVIVEPDENTSRRVMVTVDAEDMSGDTTTAQKNFVIDPVAPVIDPIEFSSEATAYEHNGTCYYGDTVTMKTVITERFLDALHDVRYTINDMTYTLSELVKLSDVYAVKVNDIVLTADNMEKNTDIQGEDDSTKTTIEITFQPDGNYVVGAVSVEDMAGNEITEEIDCSMTIDTKSPVVSVSYNRIDENGKLVDSFKPSKTDEDGETAYENAAYIQAVIVIEENNFDSKGWKDFDLQLSTVNYDGTDVDLGTIEPVKTTSETKQTYTVTWKTDARYKLDVVYKDLAGNPAVFKVTDSNGEEISVEDYEPDYFTIDHMKPNGTITVSDLANIPSDAAGFDKESVSEDQKTNSWINKFLDAVNPLRWFGQVSVKVETATSDTTSGVKTVAYYTTNQVKAGDDLENLYEDENTRKEWKDLPEKTFNADQNVIIYQRVEDYAGNIAYYSTDKITVDNTNSEDHVTITPDPETPGRDKGIYIDTEVDKFVIEVTDPAPASDEDAYAGFREVSYTLSDNNGGGLNREKTVLRSYDSQTHQLSDTYEVKIPTTKEYSCDLTIEVTVLDWSNNTYTVGKTITIDPVAPEVTTKEESASSEKNGRYYSENVILTTEITERYLDIEQDVVYTINGQDVTLEELIANKADYGVKSVSYTQDTTDADRDQTKSYITVEFEEDNNYKVCVTVTDKAGNVGVSNECEFTVDHVDPVINVTYIRYDSGETFDAGKNANNIKYLGEDNTSFRAVVKVNEHNFFTEEASVENDTYLPKFTVKATDAEGKTILSDVVKNYADLAATQGRWGSDGDTRTFYVDIANDANYAFDFSYTDLAGREAKVTTDYITLDRVRPTGTVTVDGMVNGNAAKTWAEYFLNSITFGLFGKNNLGAAMTSQDVTSGVKSTQYLATSQLLSREDLKKRTDWKTYQGRLGLSANQNVIVYEKVVDKAGNTEYFSTENLVADNTDPAPVVTITPSSPSWGKGVYSAGDNPGFDIRVTDPTVNNAYSGLKEITYQIVNGTTGATETGTLASISRDSHQQTWTGHVSINPEKFYSNDVRVTVNASDWSTNEAVSETATLKVDNKAPIVKFSFDKSDAQNTKYYKNNKTLTITVDERNFDQSYVPKVTSTAGGGYSFSGWSTSGEITTGTITFSGDSDFTVTFDCYDLAGNKSNTENLEEFTVDKTNPVISVSYDNDNAQNGSYYKASRTATITINEHNFRAGDVRVTTTASNGSAPSVSGWSSSGDRHTATVSFSSDADYTFDIEYTDMAGNSAADYDQDKFTVDLTKPVLEITGVANKSANKGTVAPVIKVSDTNFIASGVTLTLKGVNKGNVSVDNMISKATAPNGQTITFLNFGANMDDIYTLTAKSVDKAGNETTKSITFSVNRDGSAYTINDYAKGLLEKGYTNSPKDIVITETNVDTLEFIEISISKNGQIKKLTEGEDYKVKAEGGDGQWKKYTYTIFAKCFEDEGEYSINISSTDRAENVSNNKVQNVNVDFVVDKTAPVMAVSNLENRGRYKENSHEYTLNVKDNSMLVSVQIYLDDELYKTYKLVNGKLVNVNDANDVLEMDNGKVYLSVDSKSSYQKIKLVSTDAAGNVSETEEYNVLVTTSNWVQFYSNKPLFFGCIAAIIAVCAIIFFIIWKRRKNEEEEQKKSRKVK